MSDGRSRAQEMIATENVQREEAIVFVIPVKEAAQLMAVDRVVSSVEVEDNPVRRHGVGLKKQLDEEVFDGSCITSDLLVPAILVSPDGGQLESIQGTFARQGHALITLAEP